VQHIGGHRLDALDLNNEADEAVINAQVNWISSLLALFESHPCLFDDFGNEPLCLPRPRRIVSFLLHSLARL
jgi:hypothetical protein